MQARTALKILIPMISVFLLIQGCNTTDSPASSRMNTATLFPFQTVNNWWKYHDTNPSGYTLSITVHQASTDNSNTYYTMSYIEKNVETTVDLFRRTTIGTEYGTSFAGPFSVFLPAELAAKAGTFSTGSTNVTYTFSPSAAFGAKVFQNVFQLSYATPLFHGFNKLAFADSIGIISLADTASRVKVIYVLDSSFVGGKLKKY